MRIEKLFRLEASHRLPKHVGKCYNLHGHSWRIKVAVDGEVDPESGFVMDFSTLGSLVKPVVEFMDHKHFNWFITNPTSERIAELMGFMLEPLLGKFAVLTVEVSETENSWASARFVSPGLEHPKQVNTYFRSFLPQREPNDLRSLEHWLYSIEWCQGTPQAWRKLIQQWENLVFETRNKAYAMFGRGQSFAVKATSNTPTVSEAMRAEFGQYAPSEEGE